METIEKKKVKKPFIHVDILDELTKVRDERLDSLKKQEEGCVSDAVLADILGRSVKGNNYELESLLRRVESGNIFSKEEIAVVAKKYALHFASVKRFKAEIPKSVLSKLKDQQVNRSSEVFILAPLKAFNHTYYSDPVMFLQVNQGYVVIDKWGNDFTWFRRLKSADFRGLHYILCYLGVASGLLGAIGVWFSPLAWYWCTVLMLGSIVWLLFTTIVTIFTHDGKTEPFFYDPKQWDRVDIKMD